jgi:hypothetical protein
VLFYSNPLDQGLSLTEPKFDNSALLTFTLRMKQIKILVGAFFFSSALMALPSQQIYDFDHRYQLNNWGQKLVDNFGEGYEDLYGVRNFRVVLKGLLYRGGANNAYNKYGKRNNQNPLPDLGLKNLCQQDFKSAVYLYDTNFSKAPKSMNCQNSQGQKNQITYTQLNALNEANTKSFLKMIYSAIKEEIPSPIYMHCWNGWHASGLVSTLAIRQFCGLDANAALSYWMANTDGNSNGFANIKKRIQNFVPYPEFQISEQEQREICPQN